MSSCQYRKSHCGFKTILRPSYLHNGISYTGKMTYLYWIRAQMSVVSLAAATLRWRHNGHDSVSNHQHHDCLLNRLFRRRSKKTSKLRVTGRCVGNSPVTGEFPTQRASNAENISIWWRHHDLSGRSNFSHRPHSRQVTGVCCTEVVARQSWAEYSSRPQEHDIQVPHANCSVMYR